MAGVVGTVSHVYKIYSRNETTCLNFASEMIINLVPVLKFISIEIIKNIICRPMRNQCPQYTNRDDILDTSRYINWECGFILSSLSLAAFN